MTGKLKRRDQDQSVNLKNKTGRNRAKSPRSGRPEQGQPAPNSDRRDWHMEDESLPRNDRSIGTSTDQLPGGMSQQK